MTTHVFIVDAITFKLHLERDGCKTIPATILSFRLRHRQTSQNAFRRS